jgi:hypothetical protein
MTDRIKRQIDKSPENEFHRVMRALVRVPKAEVEEQERREREKRETKARKRKA